MGLGRTVDFTIAGVTPGRYRVRVLWDRAEPYHADDARQFIASPGDLIATEAPVVNLRAGKTVRITMSGTRVVRQ